MRSLQLRSLLAAIPSPIVPPRMHLTWTALEFLVLIGQVPLLLGYRTADYTHPLLAVFLRIECHSYYLISELTSAAQLLHCSCLGDVPQYERRIVMPLQETSVLQFHLGSTDEWHQPYFALVHWQYNLVCCIWCSHFPWCWQCCCWFHIRRWCFPRRCNHFCSESPCHAAV